MAMPAGYHLLQSGSELASEAATGTDRMAVMSDLGATMPGFHLAVWQ